MTGFQSGARIPTRRQRRVLTELAARIGKHVQPRLQRPLERGPEMMQILAHARREFSLRFEPAGLRKPGEVGVPIRAHRTGRVDADVAVPGPAVRLQFPRARLLHRLQLRNSEPVAIRSGETAFEEHHRRRMVLSQHRTAAGIRVDVAVVEGNEERLRRQRRSGLSRKKCERLFQRDIRIAALLDRAQQSIESGRSDPRFLHLVFAAVRALHRIVADLMKQQHRNADRRHEHETRRRRIGAQERDEQQQRARPPRELKHAGASANRVRERLSFRRRGRPPSSPAHRARTAVLRARR